MIRVKGSTVQYPASTRVYRDFRQEIYSAIAIKRWNNVINSHLNIGQTVARKYLAEKRGEKALSVSDIKYQIPHEGHGSWDRESLLGGANR